MKSVEEMNPEEYTNFQKNVGKFLDKIVDNIHKIQPLSGVERESWEAMNFDSIVANRDKELRLCFEVTDRDTGERRFRRKPLPECFSKDFNCFDKKEDKE